MKAAAKRAWVKALRSGEYTQATGTLCKGDKDSKEMCCLGVLIDVTQDGEWVQGYDTWLGQDKDYWLYDKSSGGLSEDVLNKVGLTEDEQEILITMNDSDGKAFLEIADYVEQNL